ncbi:MAG TPA: cell division protein SepF [Pseudonocardiaceae bacterium]|jgi:cell division inhibitor SepF
MSALHRLKAYFGMVPAEELDDYGSDYREPDYHHEYRAGYEAAAPAETREPGYPAGHPAGRTRRADLDGYRDGYRDGSQAELGSVGAPLAAARMHSARRPSWAPETPVRGALAVDTAPPVREPVAPPRAGLFAEEEAHPLARIVTLHPHTYNEARPIGERYREGTPVIMNLTGMDDKDAKRLVDFAAGLAFALRGSIDKVTNKVFLLSPPNVDVSAEDRRRLAEGGIFNQR